MPKPSDPYAVRTERRAELESAYQAGLIAAYSYIPGRGPAKGPGVDKPTRGSWDIETNDGDHHTVMSGDVTLAVSMLRAGRQRPADVRSNRRIPWADVPELLGLAPISLPAMITRGRFPAELIHDVDRSNPNYVRYTDAWCNRQELIHWGRSVGLLNPDGTPNPYNVARAAHLRADLADRAA